MDSETFMIGNRTNFEHIFLLTKIAGENKEEKYSIMSLLELK